MSSQSSSPSHPAALATVQLFAVVGAEAKPLPVPAGAATFHDLLDDVELGVYSALRTFHHDRFLWLDAHFDRTDRSMELIGWDFRLDRPSLRRALDQVVTACPLADCRVRFDVLAKPAARIGVASRVVIALSPFHPVPERYLREGVRVEIARELSRAQPLVKKADFVLRRRPYPLERPEAYEHLLVDAEGAILECSSSNFHGVRGGELWTAAGGALEGITQKILLRVGGELGVRVRREHVRVADVGRLDEAFLTSSTRGLVPIVDVAGTRIGGGAPGPITAKLSRAYDELAEREAARV
jgi:branched-subunit amino acid aminotransferase/4-amino-4-deoxychorismate lyase